jgi:phosphoglycerol geranylgeranyltransferase
MTVLERIRLSRARARLHMTLIDPDKQAPEAAGRIAQIAAGAGSDAILIGGSSRVTRPEVENTLAQIKSAAALPTILFPSGAEGVAADADAIFYLSLLNSRSPRFLIREAMQAGAFLRRTGIQPISVGYLVIEPGMRAGEVGQADLIRRDDPDEAVRYAMAAENMGMSMLYLEAGSGAPEPVPAEMIVAVRAAISILLCVGGGIRYPEQAKMIAAAGADIIVTGTIVEGQGDVGAALAPLISAVKTQP